VSWTQQSSGPAATLITKSESVGVVVGVGLGVGVDTGWVEGWAVGGVEATRVE
jgi:hypothetical protein